MRKRYCSWQRKKNALIVPLEAIAQKQRCHATVLAVSPQNVVEEITHKTGLAGKDYVWQFSPGSSESEQVVIGNRSQFRNGQKVLPQEDRNYPIRETEVQTNGGLFHSHIHFSLSFVA